jgi:hypothetical protein
MQRNFLGSQETDITCSLNASNFDICCTTLKAFTQVTLQSSFSTRNSKVTGFGKQSKSENNDDTITKQRQFDRLFLIDKDLHHYEIQESLATLQRIYSCFPGMDDEHISRNVESQISAPAKRPWITNRSFSMSQ